MLVFESCVDDLIIFFQVCSVKAGGMMSLAIDSIGALWIWGNSPQPSKTKDSKFCLASIPVPVPVWDFHGHTVVKVACGNEHVVAAVSAGEMYTGGDLVCYSWGNNSHGQLGLGNKENRPRPEVIPAFNQDSPWAVYDISCGAFHTAILTQSKSYDQEIDSRCWTFGLGDNGQLGHRSTASINLPQPVEGLPQEVILISVDCGLFHTSVVSVAGEVWSWGMEKGLGLCPDASFTGHDAGDALHPRRILCSQSTGGNFTGPVQVACGAAHTVLLADDGYKIWVWGRGRSGVLGTGQSVDSFVPCVAMWPPLDEDLKEKGESTRIDEMRYRGPTAGQKAEVDDMQLLRDKLAVMERYATVLHVSIFRKPLDERTLPQLLGSGVFDVMRELENMMESVDTEELARLEMFYRSMLASVKDKLMRRRVQEMVKDCLVSMSKGRKTY